MKKLISILAIILFTSSHVRSASVNKFAQNDEGQVQFDIDAAQGSYSYSFKTPDETAREEQGYIETDPSTGEVNLIVKGQYEYIADDGRRVIVTYTADKNGFRPVTTFARRTGAPQADDHNVFEESDYPTGGVGYSGVPSSSQGGKRIDSTLLCSLAGGGC